MICDTAQVTCAQKFTRRRNPHGSDDLRYVSQMCDSYLMSDELRTVDGTIIKWDQPDRMRKALRVAGMTPGEMAAYLDVGGNTVSTWINGHIKPSYTILRLWALRTGVPLTWLHHGDLQPCDLEAVRVSAGQRSTDIQSVGTSISMQRLPTMESA
jgi:DNA-binding transcriptional regulator YiaG